ncbi:site-specific integrase [Pantoea dispersa]|uniref:site-specific integrase n=1 Tax=Pantoea dispersa TaxID=59814 RepID=UPI003989192F
MAYYSIEKRATSKGEIKYRCTVGVKKDGVIIFRERQTFSKQAAAKSWGVMRVADIEQNGVPSANMQQATTFGELLDLYTKHPNIKFGKSKNWSLNLIRRCEISEIALSEFTTNTFIEHARLREAQGAGPSTIRNDIAFIGSVLSSAEPMFNLRVDLQCYQQAKYQLQKLGMTASSQKRSRRPTQDETNALLIALETRSRRSNLKIPFHRIFLFSILSCMRIGEVTSLRWDDIDHKQKAILVRDRKHPRKKLGNHMYVALLGEAWDIVMEQPRTSELIFPFKHKRISIVFGEERNKLGIEDLRYHDLRREGASRLFEAGFVLEEVAQVTGHRSLKTLWQIYTELYPRSLHDRYKALQESRGKPSTPPINPTEIIGD